MVTSRLAARCVGALLALTARLPVARADGFDPANAPEELPYQKGERAPLGYHVEDGARAGEIASGLGLFALSYGAVVAIGSADEFENQKGYLLVPVFGPALWLSSRSSKSDGEAAPGFLLFAGVLDTLLQVGGTAIVVRECVNPPKRFVRDAMPRFLVTPSVARHFVGLSLATSL